MWPTRARGTSSRIDVDHAEAGAQHRHDHDVGPDDPGVGRSERRGHRVGVGREVAQRFGRDDQADPVCSGAERGRRRAGVAEFGQRVVRQRVIDEVERHGP